MRLGHFAYCLSFLIKNIIKRLKSHLRGIEFKINYEQMKDLSQCTLFLIKKKNYLVEEKKTIFLLSIMNFLTFQLY